MSGKKEKRFSQTLKENVKSRVQPEEDARKRKKTQTATGKTSQSGTFESALRSAPNMEKEKKKLKTKDEDPSSSKQVQRRTYEEVYEEEEEEEEDIDWFGRGKGDEAGQQESPTQNPRGYQEVEDNWDETSEQEEDIEENTGREGGTRQLQDRTGTRTIKDDENVNGAEKAEEAPILRRIAKADKALVKALLRIASLVGENDKVQHELDNVLIAHSKIKALIIEQNGEIGFQKGRNLELERLAKQTGEANRDREEEERETEEQKP